MPQGRHKAEKAGRVFRERGEKRREKRTSSHRGISAKVGNFLGKLCSGGKGKSFGGEKRSGGRA